MDWRDRWLGLSRMRKGLGSLVHLVVNQAGSVVLFSLPSTTSMQGELLRDRLIDGGGGGRAWLVFVLGGGW